MPTNCFLLHYMILHSLPTLELRSIKENGNYLSAGRGGGSENFRKFGNFLLTSPSIPIFDFRPNPTTSMMKNKILTPSTHFSTQFDNHNIIKTIVDMYT